MACPAEPVGLNGLAAADSVFRSVPETASVVFPVLLAVAIVPLLVCWVREHRMARHRRVTRRLYRLGEQMVACSSASESIKILRAVLPEALRVTQVYLYLYDRGMKVLRPIEEGPPAELAPHLEIAATACLRNRSLLVVPDTRKSPLMPAGKGSATPRSAMFVPMFARADIIGILALVNAGRARHFSSDEQSVAQHLANQTAIGLRLRERETLRERLLRDERLAASGELIASVAAELKAPIEAISKAAERLAGNNDDTAAGPDLLKVSAEARRASGIVEQLLAFSRTAPPETSPVDLVSVVRGLIAARAGAWKQREIEFQDLLSNEPAPVNVARRYLQQVLLSLLAHAENAAAAAPIRRISVRSTRLADTHSLEIGFSRPLGADEFSGAADPDSGALSLDVCRGIVQTYGGQLRLAGESGGAPRFEVTLPAIETAESRAQGKPPRQLTTLVVEPELAAQRRLVAILGERGHRSVPVGNAEEAADLARRLAFDVLFCSDRLPGRNYVELFEEIGGRFGAFVLLTEHGLVGLPNGLPRDSHSLLGKPVVQEEFNRLMSAIELRLAGRPR